MSRSRITVTTLMDAVTISSETKYTDPCTFRLCSGQAALIISSTAGTLAISQQCSVDKVNWYDPTDTVGSALGQIRLAQTVTTGIYVVFSPVMSEWTRFKVVESSASTVVTIKLLQREEVQ